MRDTLSLIGGVTRRQMRKRYQRILARFIEHLVRALQGQRAFTDFQTLERDFTNAFMNLLQPLYAREWSSIAEHVARVLEPFRVQFAQNELPDELSEWAAEHMAQVWRKHSETVVKRIVQLVAEKLQQGATYEEIKDALTQELGNLPDYALERVIRTETTRLYNYALLYETAELDTVAGYRYEVVVDPRTSEICRPLAGKVVRKDQVRFVPPLHPNCRTVLVPLFEHQLADAPPAEESDFDDTAQRFGLVPSFIQTHLQKARFWQLWNQHQNTLIKFCHQIAQNTNDAYDLLHTLMLRAHSRFHLYDPARSQFTSWCYQIAKNLYINERVKRSREWQLTEL